MNRRHGTRSIFAAAVFLSACLLHAQSTPAPAPAAQQPCTTSPQPQPCSPAPANPAGKGSATDRFPFPGEARSPGEAPNPAEAPNPTDTPKTVSPGTPSTAPSQPATDRFPFPGENAPTAPSAAAPSPGSSSSSDPTAFPSDDTDAPDPNAAPGAPGTKDKPATPEGRRLLKRVNPVGTKLLTPDEREAEDLSVAKFYTDQGNLQGAYLRAQDAVKTIPADPDAHCTLAKTALKLNKRDEAIAEFNACLKLDPEEKEAKNARRELARLK